MGVRACWAVVVVLLLLSVPASASDAPAPSFTCKSFGKFFVCTAANVDDLWPHWTLFKRGGNFEAYGPEFRANAPKAWSLIVMEVSDGEVTWSLKAYVRNVKGRAKLCREENIEACRKAAK